MKKIITFVVLIFVLLATTQIGYSYFTETKASVMSEDNPLYVINQVVTSSNERLIPTGAIKSENDTYKVTFTYEITIEEGVSIESAIENLTLMNNSLDEETLNDLFNFEVSIDHKNDIILNEGIFTDGYNGEVLTVTVEVSMNNLEYFEDYSSLNGDSLTFTLVLTVSNTQSNLN